MKTAIQKYQEDLDVATRKAFIVDSKSPDYSGFTINEEHLPLVLELVERGKDIEVVSQLQEAEPLPPYGAAVSSWQKYYHIHFLCVYLLSHRPELISVLQNFFVGLSVYSDFQLPKDQWLWKTVGFGSIGIENSSIGAKDFVQKLNGLWCSGNHPGMILGYFGFADPKLEEVALSACSAFFDVQIKAAMSYLIVHYAEARAKNKRTKLLKLAETIPWWRFKVNNSNLNFDCRLAHILRVYCELLFKSYLPMITRNNPITYVGDKQVEYHILLLTIGNCCNWPSFSPRDIEVYPPTFLPTARTLLLCWKRLGLNKDVVRNVILNYVLWNCFQEPLAGIQNLNEVVNKYDYLNSRQYFRELLAIGHVPNGQLYIDNTIDWHVCMEDYCLFQADLLRPTSLDDFRNFVAANLELILVPWRKPPGAFPESIELQLQDLRDGSLRLKIKRGAYGTRISQQFLDYLNVEGGFTTAELASWIAFD